MDFFNYNVALVLAIILISFCPDRVPEAAKVFVKSAFV